MDKDLYEKFELTGIEEGLRKAPAWFLVMMIILLVWGGYYLVTYWGGLGPGVGY